MKTLRNDFCWIQYRESKKEVFGRDLTDHNNDPAFFTKSKRGLKKTWEELTKAFTEKTTMHDVTSLFHDNKIRTHYWCMMD